MEALSGRGLVRGGILVTAHVDNFLSSGRWNLRNFAKTYFQGLMAVPTVMWGVAVVASHFNSKHNMETNEIDYKGLAQSARRELNERMEGFISRM